MKTRIEPLLPGAYYHIYNRGINGENLFREERNYNYFLEKYTTYILPIAETYAYCLLKNHFHLLIKIRDTDKIIENINRLRTQKGLTLISASSPKADDLVSKQFAHFFNSYAKTINHTYGRTGGLFETPFRRKMIEFDSYFSRTVYYIHHNPQKHGFCRDFKNYPYSSYHSHLSTKMSRLEREQIIKCFGSQKAYRDFHEQHFHEADFKDIALEF